MANAEPLPQRMTLAEFLEWSPGDDRRFELLDGRLVMMNPPKVPHADIATNVMLFLATRLKPPCRVNQAVGVLLDERTDTYLEADVAVSCESRRPGQQHLEQPRLIVEVLSPSTKDHDLGRKLERYWELPSVEEILLVSSTERVVRHWRRDGEEWRMRPVIGKGAIHLAIVDAGLDLDTIYEGVVF